MELVDAPFRVLTHEVDTDFDRVTGWLNGLNDRIPSRHYEYECRCHQS
jgi:hypothetical protein